MTDLTPTLDYSGKVALYEQLYRYISGEIESGRIKSGEKMPSKRALSRHLGISVSTVETVYSILVSEGYLVSKPKSGYYVERLELPSDAAGNTKKRTEFAKKPVAAPQYRYTFSTSEVSTELFPYSSWAKLTKEVVYESSDILKRGDKQGDLDLRIELAGFLHQYRGVNCAPEQIIVGAGMEYLTDLLLQLIEPSRRIALETPCYNATYHTMKNNLRDVCFISQDSSGMRVDLLEKSGADIAYVTPSHQFPMGTTMPVSRRSALIKWANEKPERYIIEDDYDSEFRYGSRPIPAMQSRDSAGRVVYIGTLSRSLAPSIRIAFMVLPESLLARYSERFGFASSTVSRLEQQILRRFIASGMFSRHLRRVGLLYRRKRDIICSRLLQNPDISVTGAQAGLHFVMSCPPFTEAEILKRCAARNVRLHGLSEYAHGLPCRPSSAVVGFAGLSESDLDTAGRIIAETLRGE